MVILSDKYDDKFVSYDMVERLSKHPKTGSFCYHKDGLFVIQLGNRRDNIDSAQCCLYEPKLQDYQIILGNKWLDERNATFNQTTSIL